MSVRSVSALPPGTRSTPLRCSSWRLLSPDSAPFSADRDSSRPVWSSTVTWSLASSSTLLATRKLTPWTRPPWAGRPTASAPPPTPPAGRAGATEHRGLLERQVDARALHAVHLPDGPLQLALQGATVVDALGEVRHAPGRLVEQLEPRPPLPGQAPRRQLDPGTGQRPSPAPRRRSRPPQPVFDLGLVQRARDLAHLLQGMPRITGTQVGTPAPAGDAAEAPPPPGGATHQHQALRRPWRRVGKEDRSSARPCRSALHVDHGAVRLQQLVADLDEQLQGDPGLLRGRHDLVQLHRLAPQERADGVACLCPGAGRPRPARLEASPNEPSAGASPSNRWSPVSGRWVERRRRSPGSTCQTLRSRRCPLSQRTA
jgi:hypothetical protein